MKRNNSEKNNRGLVLTLKPDNAQKLLLDKHLNDTRFIYNQYVEEYLKALKEERIPNYKDPINLRSMKHLPFRVDVVHHFYKYIK